MSVRLSRALLVAALCLAPAFAAESSAQAAPSHWSIIHAGQLLAIPGQPPMAHKSLIVRDGRVVEVRDGFVAPGDVAHASDDALEVIDLSDKFVMPGLIDCHTHLTVNSILNSVAQAQLQEFQLTDADIAIAGVVNARTVLLNGFTTVRNPGDPRLADAALKRAIDSGQVPGPRMLTAGPPLGPSGSQDDPKGYRPEILAALDEMHEIERCDGAVQCRALVRRTVARGADFIKIKSSGGVGSVLGRPDPRLYDDELTAVVQTAHNLGVKVAAHAMTSQSIKASLRAGVDSIEHGTQIDEETVRLFRQTGAYLVPTLLAPADFVEQAPGSGRPVDRQRAEGLWTMTAQSMAIAYKGGVKFAFGSDIGYSKAAAEPREFLYMAKVGISPMDSLRAATVNAADLLGLSREVGTLEPGKQADVIATDASPLDDIAQMTRVSFVMKGGTTYKSDHLATVASH